LGVILTAFTGVDKVCIGAAARYPSSAEKSKAAGTRLPADLFIGSLSNEARENAIAAW